MNGKLIDHPGIPGSAPSETAVLVRPSSPAPFPDVSGREGSPTATAAHRRTTGRPNGRNELSLIRDAVVPFVRDGILYLVSEDYSYKTGTYYTILRHELEGRTVRPSTAAVLDAYVVPLCLERAGLAGIPVCDWEISQAYVPLPSIVYGLNYFAASSDFFVARNAGEAKDVIRHVTNKGKYPFCYQKIGGDATIHSCTAIFGETFGNCTAVAPLAKKVYELFAIPLVKIIVVREGGRYTLSSLAPVRYSQLSGVEHAHLVSHIVGQEHL